MYKQYLNDYEKRAEEIRKAARAVENGGKAMPVPTLPPKEPQGKAKEAKGTKRFESASRDDLLLLALLFLLITNEEKDMTLILTIGYLFLSGL